MSRSTVTLAVQGCPEPLSVILRVINALDLTQVSIGHPQHFQGGVGEAGFTTQVARASTEDDMQVTMLVVATDREEGTGPDADAH